MAQRALIGNAFNNAAMSTTVNSSAIANVGGFDAIEVLAEVTTIASGQVVFTLYGSLDNVTYFTCGTAGSAITAAGIQSTTIANVSYPWLKVQAAATGACTGVTVNLYGN